MKTSGERVWNTCGEGGLLVEVWWSSQSGKLFPRLFTDGLGTFETGK